MDTDADLPEHVQRNRTAWDCWATDYAGWVQEEPTWGEFAVPEAEVGALPPSVEGMDAIELGCGTACVSDWLARRGARPVGIDNSPTQLATARRMQEEFGIAFPLHLGNAEDLPFADERFDLAVSEYGASIWCDPYMWIPEAARVLRPGGRLIYLVNSVVEMLCMGVDDTVDIPVGETLKRPQFGMHRFDWVDDESVEFHLPHGEMIRLLHASGFAVERLIELKALEHSTHTSPQVSLAWARQWPAEEIWCARKTSP